MRLSKGTIEACVLPWEVLPSIKGQELTRFHSEFDPAGGALYTAAFVMAMNTKRYESLPDRFEKGHRQQLGPGHLGLDGQDPARQRPGGRKTATDRGNTVITLASADAQEFKRKAAVVEVEWMAEMDQRGLNGRQLRDTARALIEKYGKTAKG